MLIKKLVTLTANSLFIGIISSLSILVLLSQQAVAGELTINVSALTQGKGHVLVGLYAGEKNYIQEKAIIGSRIKVHSEQMQVIFKDIADGVYAVSLYQDENDNNSLDFNLIGIPTEGYGFSNNIGRFGRPSYQEAKFTVKGNAAISIALF